MRYRYKNLSPGYLGEQTDTLTLNSKFYALFNLNFAEEALKLGDEIKLFPQRIPRKDFFHELLQLEGVNFKIGLNARLYDLKSHLLRVSQIASNTHDEMLIRHYINWISLCLRHGCFDEIVNLPNPHPDQPFSLEIQLLKEASIIENQLSSYLPISTDRYHELAKIHLNSTQVSLREKIILTNQLIVTHYRHGDEKSRLHSIIEYAKQLEGLLNAFESSNFLNQLYCSVGYRGLAMVSEFGHEKQQTFLNRAESIAMSMNPESDSDKIIAEENKLVCFQSIAKWHQFNNKMDAAESYLNKMIEIDPYDSTGHSELGFHHLKQENFHEAAICFKSALILGPAGTGMNAYYYAKCLEQLDRKNDAIEFLFQSAELDPQAISPLLDLIDLYIQQKETVKAHSIAKHILNTELLNEQLDSNEISYLHNLIQ